jgi:siderophore synthetase component
VNAYKLIGVDELTLGHFLRELNHTLLADCHLLSNDKNDNSYLLALPDFSHLEGFMHGHPWFVINKGRLGFSYTEYLNYAPEMRSLQQLSWIAVSKKCASFNAVNELDYQKLILSELSTPDLEYFSLLLKSLDLEPDGFYLMPVHEWQWQRQIIQLFTDDIARCDIIYLGYGSDHYLATQSIRSFNNQSHKTKFQVKLPMSIFNTAVYRGLPNRRTELAPLLSQWIKNTVALDSVFKSQRLIMLSEAASINYSHKIYTDIPGVPYQYKELLGVIWRENLNNYLTEQERAITMASLIHIDNNQRPFIQDLINKSPLDISKWLEQFFRVCIPPLLHWLYKYKVVFSPHGENTMLVLDENYCPSRLVLKDFIDDVNITDCDMSTLSDMPVELLDTLYRLPDNELSQFIHTGLFVVLYRYLSDILYSYCDYPEDKFWQQVYNVIVEYHNEHPELSEAIASINILQPMFKKLNLNRLRLLEVGYADYANRPKVESTILMYNPANQDNWQLWSKSMRI